MTIAFIFYILHSGGQWSHDFKFSSGNSCNIATSNTIAVFIFSSYVGLDPASTVYPPKNTRNIKHPKIICWFFSQFFLLSFFFFPCL